MIKAGTTAKFEYSKGELRKLRENSNTFPSKHFNIVSTFFLGQYDVARRTKSNQRRNHVAHVNVEIYNVEQRRTNAVCFNVGLNNVNVEKTMSFSTSIFITLGNVETTLRI